MIRSVWTFLFLLALWLLMSGVYKPLVIGLGVASALLATYMVRRMEASSVTGRLGLPIKPLATLRYIGWLLIEIAKSNWAVAKVILQKDMGMRQHFFTVPYSQKSDIGQATFANSITLTPGTISVEVEDGHFWVHALSYSEDDPEALAEMDAQVTRTENC